MAIIKKFNKDNNTTYVYESTSYWVPELGQPRSKRKLIGKIDPETGEIVPTAGRGRKSRQSVVSDDNVTVVEEITPIPGSTAATTSKRDDFRTLYETCKQQLQEKEAALVKAENKIAAYTRERKELEKQFEQILHRLRN